MRVLEGITSRPMTRSEFLKVAGVMIISVVGIGNLLALLRGQSSGSGINSNRVIPSRGFGSGRYGL